MKRYSILAAVLLTGCAAVRPGPQTMHLVQPKAAAPAPAPAATAPATQPAPATKRVLVQTTAGAKDPTRAVLAFVGAFGAAQAGHDVTLVLAGDAAALLNDATAEATSDTALGSIKDWFPRIQKYKIPIYV